MIGTTIGNYVVRDKIGEGGMGVVYVAEHPRIGRKVAIKVLLPEFSQNAEVVSRFFTEAKASSAIKNDHIIDIIDYGELADKSSYIIMEWLEGEPLTTTLEREKKIPLERALHIARGIGRALAAAHRNGIVHRDLKPDNIFLVTRGDDNEFAKVLDFGIAKLLGNEGAGKPAIASKTRTGAIIGTPMYMSPEQCRGVAVDERSDIYSFAVIVYQMLCGKIPFEAEGLGELLLKHMTEAPRPLCELEPSLPPGVEKAVLHALEKDPAARFRRVEDFITELGGQPTVAMDTARPTAPLTAALAAANSAPISLGAPILVGRGNAVGAQDTIGAASGEAFTSAPRKRTSIFYAIVPAAALITVGVGLALRPAKIDKPIEMQPAVSRPVVPTTPVNVEPAVAPVAPPPKVAEVPALVQLSVSATPAGAEITVDGRKHENPYTEDLPRDGHVYAVEVRANGYVTRREKLTLDEPRHLGVVLVAEHGKSHGKSVALPGAPPSDGKGDPIAKKTDTPAPKSDHPAEKAPDEKGPTIYKGTKGKLITDDPFAK